MTNNLPARNNSVPPGYAYMTARPSEPVIGSRASDAISLGRLIDRQHGVTEKIRYGGDQHVLVFGPNGKGKGTRVLMPNLLQMAGNKSIVVVDPKGELAAVTAPFRRSLGKVVIINPFGVLVDIPGYRDLKSDGFNPLAQLDPESKSFNKEAAQMSDALISVDPKDPHWGNSARALVAATIMYTVVEAREKRLVPTMARVRDLICQASSKGDPLRGVDPVGIPATALKMMESGIAGLRNKASQFTDWNREIQGIASTAKIQTEPFDDEELSEDISKDGFDFRELKLRPTTVYLILPPDDMERHSKWLRLVLTSAIQAVLRVRRPGEPKVLFMLDEFFALGHLEIVSTVWALVRGYGVQMMPVLQDLPQLKKLYPDMWETFIGMAGAILSFATTGLTTAEWLSRRAGETERQTESYNSSENSGSSSGGGTSTNSGSENSGTSWNHGTSSGSSSGYSRSQTKAPLMSPHKFFGLPPGFGVLTLDGLSDMVPIYAPAYYDIRQCWLVARDNPYYQEQ